MVHSDEDGLQLGACGQRWTTTQCELLAHPAPSPRQYYSFARGRREHQNFATRQGLLVDRFNFTVCLQLHWSFLHGYWLYGVNRVWLKFFTKSRKATTWKILPADSELDAIDTKSLQRFSQNFEADSKSFARSFSWWEIKIVIQRVNSFLLLRIYQSRSKIAFRFTNHVTRNTECLKF